jgi:two-component sensor histidine kinase
VRDVDAELIHDMQNTATVLHEAASQLHENRTTLPPGVVAHLAEMMVRRSDMLVRLLADLSTSHLAERDELDICLERVALPDICQELLEERAPGADTHITVDVTPDAVVVGDPVRITQVLDNLVTNALRYGGPNVHVSASRVDSSVRLTVSDDGAGVPPDMVDALFQAYVHGEASHSLGGSGLGLLIVRQLCEAMGGTIEYDDAQGTRFTVTLPALPVPTAEISADVAGAGHSVALWHTEERLAESLVAYVANGLADGEAVLVATTPSHLRLLESGLDAIGIDHAAATATGQLVVFDADALHEELPGFHHIDRERFDALIGRTIERVSNRWSSFRVFGEIVDLYWRRSEVNLALELETCWNDLRARVPFALMCGYEVAPGENAAPICACHEAILAA